MGTFKVRNQKSKIKNQKMNFTFLIFKVQSAKCKMSAFPYYSLYLNEDQKIGVYICNCTDGDDFYNGVMETAIEKIDANFEIYTQNENRQEIDLIADFAGEWCYHYLVAKIAEKCEISTLRKFLKINKIEEKYIHNPISIIAFKKQDKELIDFYLEFCAENKIYEDIFNLIDMHDYNLDYTISVTLVEVAKKVSNDFWTYIFEKMREFPEIERKCLWHLVCVTQKEEIMKKYAEILFPEFYEKFCDVITKTDKEKLMNVIKTTDEYGYGITFEKLIEEKFDEYEKNKKDKEDANDDESDEDDN